MNKSELIENVAEQNGLTKVNAKKIVESVLENIAKGTREKGKVSLLGFGNFSTTIRAARQGRNPKTGETLEIPAKEVVKFKASF
jgi:DNA-binding protein HU-beta